MKAATVRDRRVAGSDTRDAMSTPTVRAAFAAAAFGSAPGWATAISAPAAWSEHLSFTGTALWFVPILLIIGAGSALGLWRLTNIGSIKGPPAPVVPTAAAIVFAIVVAASGDARLGAVALPLVPLVSGLIAAYAVTLAARACVAGVRPAATGIVAAYALLGVVPGLHITMVAFGSGLPRAAGWSAAYFSAGLIATVRAMRSLPADQRRITVRERYRIDPTEVQDAALAMRGISLRFGPNLILDEAALQVHPGELVALVGANGAGKSTLLRVAGGFLPIETGQVVVAGEDVTTLLPEERAAAGLSFVSGARPVFPELTVLQNLRVAAYRTHQTASSFEAATTALLGLIPTLERRTEDLAGVLSGGEQRLLAVAQTLYRKPAVLLADELTLGLDVDARLAVMDLLAALAEQGVAVVAVDHDLPALLPRASRVALLTDGAITSHDDPIQILTKRSDLLPATFLAGVDG